MNLIEKIVYDVVKKNPRLKFAVRNTYQALFDLLPRQALQSSFTVVPREGFFFGFHDHTPFSPGNTMLAAGRFDAGKPLHMPQPGEELEVGFFSGEGFMDWNPVAQTKAWNWHQGCKLQWLGNEDKLVFNDHEDGRNIARVVSVTDPSDITTLPVPVASVSPDGAWAVSYGFERVEKLMPGYGYLYKTGLLGLDDDAPENDGIRMVDLRSGNCELIISIRQLCGLREEPSMLGASHYFSHALFSPSSKRFAFLHRWIKDDVIKRWSRIVTADVDGGNIRIYPARDMASHLGWRNDNELLVYCRLANGQDCYALFNDDNSEEYTVVAGESFNSDGHPAWSPDGRFFVTDTYPDRRRIQHLALYDAEACKRIDLAKLASDKQYASGDPFRHWSCDLHPRWDRTGRYVCFDSTYTGQRALCTLDLGAPLAEKWAVL
jgi:hypothetical protein